MQVNKIKGYRNYLNLTQEDMGNELGISKQSYWNKETSRSKFTDEEKKKIKNLLVPYFPNITMEDIFF